jgi:hypothetical protein
LAKEFHDLEPWKYLTDCNMLGIEDASCGKIRLASVLGNAGQVFGFLVHRGEPGLRWALTAATDNAHESHDPNSAHSQDCSSVEFVPKRDLDADDLVLLAQIGFKPFPRTRLGWLKFRSLRPGAAPWHLDQAEADLLLSDLRKIVQFARLASQQKNLFERRAANELPFYPKEAIVTNPLRSEDLEWQKLVLAAEPPPKAISLSDPERVALTALPRDGDLVIELDCLYSPGLVTEGSRPYFPWMSLVVDAHNGLVLATELENSQTEKPEHAAGRCLLRALRKLKCRPREILVMRNRIALVLAPVVQPLGITIFKVSCLPWLDQAFHILRRGIIRARKGA